MHLLVACTGLNPSTRQKVRALEEAGLLKAFLTTVAFREGRLSGRLPRSRRFPDLPEARLRRWPWMEAVRLLSSRLDPTGILTDRLWEVGDRAFASRAARHLEGCQGVLGFEHSSLELFEAARARGLTCFYDVPSAHSGLIQRLLAPLYDEFPSLRTAYRRHTTAIESRRQARRDREVELADVVIAHSTFCRRSYIEAGFPAEKILSVPYGAPPVDEPPTGPLGPEVPAREDGRPTFLFAGNFALHKGALTLWEAWRELGDPGARLIIAGDVFLPQDLLRSAPPGITYLGRVPWPQLRGLYRRSTALVFPTLSDGFGMVVTEAMAHGLPVITTPNAGAADLIEEGVNGLVVPILDARALAAAMARLAADRDLVGRMKAEALAAARRWQWPDFRKAFAGTVQERLHGA